MKKIKKFDSYEELKREDVKSEAEVRVFYNFNDIKTFSSRVNLSKYGKK